MFSPSYEPPAQKRAVEAWGQHSQGLEGGCWPPYRAQKSAKTAKEMENPCFHKNCFFYNSGWNLGGLGVSGGRAWTIRRDSLELWQGLVLQDMGEVDFHVFWKDWKLTSSPNTSKLVLGPPDWSSDFFKSLGAISGAIK
jgi:hypothetical protein